MSSQTAYENYDSRICAGKSEYGSPGTVLESNKIEKNISGLPKPRAGPRSTRLETVESLDAGFSPKSKEQQMAPSPGKHSFLKFIQLYFLGAKKQEKRGWIDWVLSLCQY